jgi:hypothetical protein
LIGEEKIEHVVTFFLGKTSEILVSKQGMSLGYEKYHR